MGWEISDPFNGSGRIPGTTFALIANEKLALHLFFLFGNTARVLRSSCYIIILSDAYICDLFKNYGDFVQSSVCTTFASIMLLSGGHNPNDYFATFKLIQYTQMFIIRH